MNLYDSNVINFKEEIREKYDSLLSEILNFMIEAYEKFLKSIKENSLEVGTKINELEDYIKILKSIRYRSTSYLEINDVCIPNEIIQSIYRNLKPLDEDTLEKILWKSDEG